MKLDASMRLRAYDDDTQLVPEWASKIRDLMEHVDCKIEWVSQDREPFLKILNRGRGLFSHLPNAANTLKVLATIIAKYDLYMCISSAPGDRVMMIVKE